MDDKEILMREMAILLSNSQVMPEEKLAVVMMLSFKLLSETQTEMINMQISKGRNLVLKFEENKTNH
ncbi:hypothetical protein [Photorhabdus sp. SF281]|uniref:hypothetical protein n=1 Tax=Photorhabdus sp. SF281 TaxID=3459527 RepID=UPI0040442E04